MPLGSKVGSEEKQANIPSMYRPPREECTLGTDDVMLLKYSPELLQAILTLRGYGMAYSNLYRY
jgi:hypothetical protein